MFIASCVDCVGRVHTTGARRRRGRHGVATGARQNRPTQRAGLGVARGAHGRLGLGVRAASAHLDVFDAQEAIVVARRHTVRLYRIEIFGLKTL